MKKNGFTLVELMIAVAIVAILAMIAIPSYSAYIKRANRTDATKTLTLDAQALERCYSQSFAYAGCAGASVGTQLSPQGKYNVTIAVPDTVTPGAPAQSYLITAVAVSPDQLGDTACRTFTLNTTNTQTAADSGGGGNTQTCWGST
jgi:type IV pilus assembly protein PilE